MTYDEWLTKYDHVASQEGWSLFDTGGGSHAPLELQAIDQLDEGAEYAWGPPWQPDDPSAWVHVIQGALNKVEHCAAALRVLKDESPAEFDHILDWALFDHWDALA